MIYIYFFFSRYHVPLDWTVMISKRCYVYNKVERKGGKLFRWNRFVRLVYQKWGTLMHHTKIVSRLRRWCTEKKKKKKEGGGGGKKKGIEIRPVKDHASRTNEWSYSRIGGFFSIRSCVSFNRKAIQAGDREGERRGGEGEPWMQKETDGRVCNALYLWQEF